MSDPECTSDADRLADFHAMVKRADAGDQTVLPAVKAVFDGVPGLWDAYGDLARTAENALIELVAGKSVLTRRALRMKIAAMRADLAGPDASPLELLLAERVVACWLQSHQADLAYARSLEGSSWSDVEHYQRRQDRAARLYLKALQSLATVRRLLVPALQLNFAEQQVNIAGQRFRREARLKLRADAGWKRERIP